MWDDEAVIFSVVINEEEQYSIWPLSMPVPSGWRIAGFQGRKDECLAHIDEVWTDMRPLSIRATAEPAPLTATAKGPSRVDPG